MFLLPSLCCKNLYIYPRSPLTSWEQFSQGYLRCCLPGLSPNFAPNKTLGCAIFSSLFLFFIFSLSAAPWHMELPSQGSDPSHSLDLSQSYGNAGSLTHYAGLGMEHWTHCSQDVTLPLCHSGDPVQFFKVDRYLEPNQPKAPGSNV